VLESFEREVAGGGEMKEERAAAATMARCALAAASDGTEKADRAGRELYDEFIGRYPKSAYATRLRRSCLHKP
jgi:hypothetical protein